MSEKTISSPSALEREMIEFFEHLSSMLSMPHSLGQIFGILYASENPLCFEDIQTALDISKGSTSNGLKALREMGAIQVVALPPDRRDFYTCEHSLRKLAEAFLTTRLIPHLDNGKDRIKRMEELLEKEEGSDHLKSAVGSLKTWMGKSKLVLPVIRQILK